MTVFTCEQVTNLLAYQQCGRVHPFTCRNRDETHGEVFGDKGTLIPTVRGWICLFCDYTQDWAQSEMLDGSAVEMLKTFVFDATQPGREELVEALRRADEPAPEPLPEGKTRVEEAMFGRVDDDNRRKWQERVNAARLDVVALARRLVEGDGK